MFNNSNILPTSGVGWLQTFTTRSTCAKELTQQQQQQQQQPDRGSQKKTNSGMAKGCRKIASGVPVDVESGNTRSCRKEATSSAVQCQAMLCTEASAGGRGVPVLVKPGLPPADPVADAAAEYFRAQPKDDQGMPKC